MPHKTLALLCMKLIKADTSSLFAAVSKTVHTWIKILCTSMQCFTEDQNTFVFSVGSTRISISRRRIAKGGHRQRSSRFGDIGLIRS
ncbi:hypothetical protein XELAEV_18042662mg [Xenopus laevis]|uniref:Secreted protein n=1 Tax=Xenopus laevis TaxID=8355 RepID=A0A974C4C1_XENLA|nr:hypothetical protein XELAEV_18042662mg [Xenopus laevis]